MDASGLIFLIGYRGTGKTTVARLLAGRLGWGWVDADDVLERRFGRAIRDIFAAEGEPGFRAKETQVLEELCGLRQHLVATGGGVVLSQANRQMMKAAGRVVWLTADAQTLWNRLQADASTPEHRPPLTTGGLEEIVDLQRARAPYYAACADWTVDTVGRTPEQVADAILAHLSLESK